MEKKQPTSRTKRLCNSLGLLVRQFLLILGKNFLLQFRRPIGTIVELLIPIIAVGVIMAARVTLLSFDSTSPTKECFVTFPSDPLILHDSLSNGDRIIYYAPNTSEVQPLVDVLGMKLNETGAILVGVESQEQFGGLIRNNEGTWCHGNIGPGIFFENVTDLDIKYTIRMRPETTWNTGFTGFSIIGARVDTNSYFTEGFVQLEKLIDESIYEWRTGVQIPYNINTRQLPYPNYERDTFLQGVDAFLTLFFVVSLIYTAGVIVKELVLEKETRIKETMKMMGLSNWILTLTWYLKQMIFLFFPILVITLFLKYGQIYPNSDGFLLLVFLMSYVSAGIAFCFFVSVWFSSTRIGLMAGMIAWFAFYFPYFFLSAQYDTLNLATKVGVCLLPNTCVGLGTKVLALLETRNEGLLFTNFGTPVSIDDSFHMGWVIFMLFIDTILYMTLYWYIDAVKPGKYGTPKPFYFLFLPSYWCGKSAMKVKPEDVADFINPHSDSQAHETEPTGIDVGISIQNLTKIYNRRNPLRRKVAVDSINLNMYKGQITALLGHNGAGKTTTMSMLTGLYTPTLGTALVDGHDITTDMDLIRRNLGICPQHNVLFDRLTVAEHLIFFSLLKGLEASKVRAEVDGMIEDLKLVDKRKTQSQRLSGGMKRKLSVGIALIGGSKIVVLDEPTSGMDPYARRGTWDLLLKHKEGRTVLLTTHFMDEADLLGDRIAIMSEGQIKCSGSSLYLKSRYGVGYHLTVVKEPVCDSMAVSGLISQHIKDAERVTDIGAELSFILPSQSVSQFPTLFDLLDENKVQLGISSFGVSVTTMEEVFIKVGQGSDGTLLSRLEAQGSKMEGKRNEAYARLEEDGPDISDNGGQQREQLEIDMPKTSSRNVVNTFIILWFQQFYAMILKRFYNFIRFWMNIIWQLVIPLLFVLLSLIFAITVGRTAFGAEPSRELTISKSSLSDNRTFFWAQFGGNTLDFNLSDINAVGINNYVWYTNDIIQLKQTKALNTTTIEDCCNYDYQILDNFCATRNPSAFMNDLCSSTSFGYNPCRGDCLACTNSRLPTCSYASTIGNDYVSSDNVCPTPPLINNDVNSIGPLNDNNVFVAERILTLSGSEPNPNDFYLRVQGGFVFSSSSVSEDDIECEDDQIGYETDVDNIDTITVWYNNQPYHMAPASLNALYSLLLRKDTGMEYTITVTNHPLPSTSEDEVESANTNPIGFSISTISIFGLSFLFASFILFPVEEKSTQAKHLQFVSGVQASSYWISSYVFDMVNALIPCILTLIMFACFNVDGYNEENLAAIFLLLIFTSWAAIPLTYIFTFLFTNPLIGFTIMVLLHYFIALIFQVVVLMIRIFDSQSNADILHYICLLHPVYALGSGLSEMYTNQNTREACTMNPQNQLACQLGGIKYADSIFEFKAPAIGHIFLYLFFEGILFIAITILIERRFYIPELLSLIKNRSRVNTLAQQDGLLYDDDVVEEHRRVNELAVEDIAEQAVVINNLSKVYHTIQCCKRQPKQAVNGINLIIPKGECFGLLGINGAGKTTTFKTLTGDISATGGTASISGYDIKTQLHQVQQRVGYCPQFDAIIERLTGRELLTMFARLRGVPEKHIKRIVQTEIERLDLTKHANKRCGTYSGGNKRKLSTAIALVGDPPIVLLDEPTTGMDPATRRFLWNALIKIVQDGKSVILTSHSMEECEALCTRLAIMVNGQFKCLGSLQHLKNKFGSGYTMQIRIQATNGQQQQEETHVGLEKQSSRRSFRESFKRQQSNTSTGQSPVSPTIPINQIPNDTNAIKAFINSKFPGALLLEEYQSAVTYRIPGDGISLSYMFSVIEQNKTSQNIVDYSVSQTTLDQIFINFAKQQQSEDD